MVIIEELQKELKELENKKKYLVTTSETQSKINILKNEIRMMELNSSKPIKVVKTIYEPIKTIARGFKKTGQYIWSHGLKDVAEQAGESGRRMAKEYEKKK